MSSLCDPTVLLETLLSAPRCKFCTFESVDKQLVVLHERILHPAEMSALFYCLFCPAKLNSIVGVQLHTSRKHGINHIPQLSNEPSVSGADELKNVWVLAEDSHGQNHQYRAKFYLKVFANLGSSYRRLAGEDPTHVERQSLLLFETNQSSTDPNANEDKKNTKSPRQINTKLLELKSYSCATCDFSSKYGSSLRRHLKSHINAPASRTAFRSDLSA